MTSTEPITITTLPPPPTPVRLGAMVVAAVLVLSALPVLWLTLVRGDAVLWFSTVFELLVIAAGVFGVFSGLGRFRQGWGLSLACVAGTVLVCGVFAFVEIRANFGTDAAIAGVLKPFLAFRLGLAGLLGLLATLAVFSRDRSCWGAFIRGVLVLAPAVGVLAWLGTSGGSFLSATRATPGDEAARILMLCLGGLVLVGLISVGGHLLIRAYEHGRADAEPEKA
jgi:hypothetical protein